MENIPSKTNGVNTLADNEFNSINDELRTIIVKGGETLPGPNDQIATSIASFVAMADFYTDSGAADSYQLTPGNGLTGIAGSAFFDGMRVRFFPQFTNTGTTTAFVTLSGLPAKEILMQNGDPLVQGEIVADEMHELIFKQGDDHFVIASSSSSRMITEDKSITVGAGQQFATFKVAIDSLRDKYILDTVTVNVNIIGKVIETETTELTHSEGNRIKVNGETTLTAGINSATNAMGAAGAWDITYTLAVSHPGSLAVGDYVVITDTVPAASAAKEYNRKHEGIWKVKSLPSATEVEVTNTFSGVNADKPVNGDFTGGTMTFLPSQIEFTSNARLHIDSTFLGGLQDIVLREDGLGSLPILQLDRASVRFSGIVGVPTSNPDFAIQLNDSILSSRQSNSGNIFATGKIGINCRNSTLIVSNSLMTNGCSGLGAIIDKSKVIAGEFIAVGNVSTVATGAIDAINSSVLDVGTMIGLANLGINIHGFNGTSASVETLLLAADGQFGTIVENGSSINVIGETKMLDNDVTGPAINIGLHVIQSSTARLEGVATLTGLPGQDEAIVVEQSSSAHFVAGGNVDKGFVQSVSIITADVALTGAGITVGNKGGVILEAGTFDASFVSGS